MEFRLLSSHPAGEGQPEVQTDRQTDGWMSRKDKVSESCLLLSLTDAEKASIASQCCDTSNKFYWLIKRASHMIFHLWLSERRGHLKLTRLLVHLGHQSAVRVVDALRAARVGRQKKNNKKHMLRGVKTKGIKLFLLFYVHLFAYILSFVCLFAILVLLSLFFFMYWLLLFAPYEHLQVTQVSFGDLKGAYKIRFILSLCCRCSHYGSNKWLFQFHD